MQSKLDALTPRVSEAEERVSDIEDKLMERKEAEGKREKQLMDHEGRLQEISNTIMQNDYWGPREQRKRERGDRRYI